MRVLIVSFYYPPDVAASAFRTRALVESLRAAMPAGSQLDIVTTAPNRYESLAVDAPACESSPGWSIARFPVGSHRSGMVRQSLAFAAYARAVGRAVKGQRYDVVYATSGRLMAAVLGAFVAGRTHARIYLDIRDIFAAIMPELLPRGTRAMLAPLLSRLERYAVGRASRVNLVSPGFAPYFTARYPGREFTYFTNGIDDEFLAAASRAGAPAQPPTQPPTQPPAQSEPRAAPGAPAGVRIRPRHGVRPISIVYAGNIGEGQRLHAIIPQLSAVLGERVRFRVIGDGGKRRALEAAVSARRLTNVELVAPMDRERLIAEYSAADVLFLHLGAYRALASVLPSKLFEYGAIGKPILAGVAGYPADFIRSELSNAAVFDPCDVPGAIRALDSLEMRTQARTDFVARFARSAISRELASDLMMLASAGPG